MPQWTAFRGKHLTTKINIFEDSPTLGIRLGAQRIRQIQILLMLQLILAIN